MPHISYLFTTVYLQTAFIFIQDSSSKLTDCQLRKDSNSIFQLIRAIISSLFELISLLFMMPSVFTRLWVAHFCSWMGLMCVILYYTEFFGEIMYQGMLKIVIFTIFHLVQTKMLYFDQIKVIQMPKKAQSTDKIMKKVYGWALLDSLHKTLLQCFHLFISTPLSSNLAKEMCSFFQP